MPPGGFAARYRARLSTQTHLAAVNALGAHPHCLETTARFYDDPSDEVVGLASVC